MITKLRTFWCFFNKNHELLPTIFSKNCPIFFGGSGAMGGWLCCGRRHGGACHVCTYPHATPHDTPLRHTPQEKLKKRLTKSPHGRRPRRQNIRKIKKLINYFIIFFFKCFVFAAGVSVGSWSIFSNFSRGAYRGGRPWGRVARRPGGWMHGWLGARVAGF